MQSLKIPQDWKKLLTQTQEGTATGLKRKAVSCGPESPWQHASKKRGGNYSHRRKGPWKNPGPLLTRVINYSGHFIPATTSSFLQVHQEHQKETLNAPFCRIDKVKVTRTTWPSLRASLGYLRALIKIDSITTGPPSLSTGLPAASTRKLEGENPQETSQYCSYQLSVPSCNGWRKCPPPTPKSHPTGT